MPSAGGVKGNCRFRDIGGVRSRNAVRSVIGLHGSNLEFSATVDMATAGSCSVVTIVSTANVGTVGSCSVVTLAVTYFFPAPRNEIQKKEAGKKKTIINKNQENNG
jgi:hypothetical protein